MGNVGRFSRQIVAKICYSCDLPNQFETRKIINGSCIGKKPLLMANKQILAKLVVLLPTEHPLNRFQASPQVHYIE